MKKRKKKINPSLSMVRRYFPSVTMVIDAEKPAVIEVTAWDNSHSDVKSHRTCALALACKRYFHASGVIIGLTTSWIIMDKVAIRYRNTPSVSREITSFDRKAGFDPGFYPLAAVTPSNKLGLERSYDPDRRAKRKEKGTFRHFTRNVRTSLHAKLL